MVSAKVAKSIGLLRYSSNPAASARSRSPTMAWAVKATMRSLATGASIRAELAQCLPAVHVGEPEIHEHQVGELARAPVRCRRRRCRPTARRARPLAAAWWPAPGSPECPRPARIVATSAQPSVRRRARRACAGAGPAGPACSGSRRRRRAGRPGRRPDITITGIALVSRVGLELAQEVASRRVPGGGRRSGSRPAARAGRRSTAVARALGGDDAVPVAAEHLLQHVDDRGIVVHAEQHALAVTGRHRLEGRRCRRASGDSRAAG